MKKVIVIGGGFAGSDVAKKLEKDFDVTLIDLANYFEFTPGVLRTIVKPEHIKKIQILHYSYLKKAKVVIGKVGEVTKRYVKIGSRKMMFDYLAICSGSTYSSPIKDRDPVMDLRAKNLRSYYDKLCKSKRVLIIGGGLVGIELAGEILSKYEDKKIILVHSKDRLMERNPEKASRYAKRYLEKRGVEIIYNEKVIKGKDKIFSTDRGRKIKSDLAFLCTGIIPNFELMKKNFSSKLNERNQVKVNEYLQLVGERKIFAAGDVNDLNVEKTAQNAQLQAKIVVNNIYALENGRELASYIFKKTPLVISLGKYNGIYCHGNFVFSGFIPALIKVFIEKWEMWKRKL